MTIKAGLVPTKNLRKMEFVYTDKGKRISGMGLNANIDEWFDSLTSVTKKNLKKVAENFNNVFGIEFKWKKLHGVQFPQSIGWTMQHKKNAGRLVWSMVYEGATPAGDKIYYVRYEAQSPGAGMSWLYANGSSKCVYVSTFMELSRLDDILEWLVETGVSRSVTVKRFIPEMEEAKKRMEITEIFKKHFSRKRAKAKADLSNLQSILFLIAENPIAGQPHFYINEESEELFESSIEIEKPLETLVGSGEVTYIMKDGAQVTIHTPWNNKVSIDLEADVKNLIKKYKLNHETLEKVVEYHRTKGT